MLNIQSQIPLAPLTTFQIGGVAKYFVEVKSEDKIREAIQWAREQGEKFTILAGGSNVLVGDEGFDGLVIHIVSDGFSFDGNILTADAGCNLLMLIRAAGAQGWGGWEKLAGIPGTIGGAVRGNAGAFGTEIKDVLVAAGGLNTKTLATTEFSNAECDFSYRHSFFKDHPEWIVTSAALQLQKTDVGESARLSEETITERERRHLQNVRAAGSYFMNPVASAHIVEMFEKEKGMQSRGGRVPAGWLIEKAGMKGATVGGAIASIQHPNYLVNDSGSATAADVLALAEKVKKAVNEQFGLVLEEEAARIP